MQIIESLDALDNLFLSKINTNLEPVSILNDIQHSSLKILLARALKNIPDDSVKNLEWKKWVGNLLVKGKHKLLTYLNAEDEEIEKQLKSLSQDYANAPNSIVGYNPPTLEQTKPILNNIKIARATLPYSSVSIETENGIINIPFVDVKIEAPELQQNIFISSGMALFKLKIIDALGDSKWKVIFNDKIEPIKIIDEQWLNEYRNRLINILPQDSLDAEYTQIITYNEKQEILEKTITITKIHKVVMPPKNINLF